jgi:cytochrome c oxidase cbb3-type subunit 4
MYKQFYSQMDSQFLPLLALFVFLFLFLGVFVRTFVMKRRSDYQPIADLPLDEKEAQEVRS